MASVDGVAPAWLVPPESSDPTLRAFENPIVVPGGAYFRSVGGTLDYTPFPGSSPKVLSAPGEKCSFLASASEDGELSVCSNPLSVASRSKPGLTVLDSGPLITDLVGNGFSDDGTTIAYEASPGGATEWAKNTLRFVRSDGSSPPVVAASATISSMRVGARQVLSITNAAGNGPHGALRLFDMTTGEATTIESEGAMFLTATGDSRQRRSPAGKTFVYRKSTQWGAKEDGVFVLRLE